MGSKLGIFIYILPVNNQNKNNINEVKKIMKKLAPLCVFVMLIEILPVFATDLNNTSIQQLQSKNPQIYQEIINIKNQIATYLDKIKALITNKNSNKEIQNLSTDNSKTLQEDINYLKNQIQGLIQTKS